MGTNMRKLLLCAIGVVSLTVGVSPSYADLGTQFVKKGNWTIMRSLDAMTDKQSCVAIYKDDPTIQLTDDSFAIGMRGKGGVSSYYLRINDQPAQGLSLASRLEKDVSAMLIEGARFQEIAQANRVRVRVLTILSTTTDFDIDMAGFAEVQPILAGAECN